MKKLLKFLVTALILISCGDGRLSPQGGTIVGVVAGTGLTGGAMTGIATVNVACGYGLTCLPDSIAVDATIMVDGSGTLNYLPLWTPDGNTLGNSSISEGGGLATISVSARVYRGVHGNGALQVDGTTHSSHFNYGVSEDTYLRGGKTTSSIIIGDSNTSGTVYLGNSSTTTVVQGGLDVNGDLTRFGSNNGDGTLFVNAFEIGFGYSVDADFDGVINNRGYQNLNTRFRNLVIKDGKEATVCTFTGSTKTLNCVGGLQVNGTNVNTFNTNNVIPKGNGTTLVASSISDDGASVTFTDRNIDMKTDAAAMPVLRLGKESASTIWGVGHDYDTTNFSFNYFNGSTWDQDVCSITGAGVMNCVGGLQVNGTNVNTFNTNNVIPKGNGTTLVASGLTDDGTSFDVGRDTTKFGDALDGQFYISGNTLNARSDLNDDTGTLVLNQTGYSLGATRYRNVIIANGKTNPIATFTGSTGATALTGNLTVGDAAGDVFDHNGDLAKFGSNNGDGTAFINAYEIGFGYAVNADFDGVINAHGYQNLDTRFRNLVIKDGKSANVATFTGSDKSLAVVGNLSTQASATLGDAPATDSHTINGPVTQNVTVPGAGGRYVAYRVATSQTGTSTAGDAAALWFSNNADNYNGYIALTNTGTSPGFLDPKLSFLVQNATTVGTGNVTERFSVTNAGADVVGNITSTDNAIFGNASGDVLDYNGDLAKFGSTDGAIYIKGDQLNAGYTLDSDGNSLAFNYNGYNGGITRFRNAVFYDGKANVACTVVGSTKTLDCVGGLQVNSVNVVTTANVSGTSGYVAMFTGTNTVGNSNLLSAGGSFMTNGNEFHFQDDENSDTPGYINYYGYAMGTTRFRDLHVANGKGATITSFIGSDKSLINYGSIYAGFNNPASSIRIGYDVASVTGSEVGFDTIVAAGGIYHSAKLATGTSEYFRVGAGTSSGYTNTWLTVDGSGNASFSKNVMLGDTAADVHEIRGQTILNDEGHIQGSFRVNANPVASTTNDSGLVVAFNGTFDTTAAQRFAGAIVADIVATRSAGANNLTNTAFFASATGGQINRALQTNEGDVLLNAASGATYIYGNAQIGDADSDTHNLYGATHVRKSAANAVAYLSVINDANEWQIQVDGGNADRFEIYDALGGAVALFAAASTGYVTMPGNTTIGDNIADTQTLNGTVDMNSGLVKFGGSDGAAYYSDTGAINSGYSVNTDGEALYLNARGYNDGTTRFRDLFIRDGKNATIVDIRGSTKMVTLNGPMSFLATTPAAISSSQNNYSGCTGAVVCRISSTETVEISGLADGGTASRTLRIVNAGTFAIVFLHEDVGSTASNRIHTLNDGYLQLEPGAWLEIVYDATISRHRVVFTSGGGSVSQGYIPFMGINSEPVDSIMTQLGPGFTVDYDVELGSPYTPASGTEWHRFAGGFLFPPPNYALYLLQETGSPLADTLDQLYPLAASGSSITYSYDETLWTRDFVRIGDSGGKLTSTVPADTSFFGLFIIGVTAVPGGTRTLIEHPNWRIEVTSDGKWHLVTSGGDVATAASMGTGPSVVAVRHDTLNSTVKLFNNGSEVLTGTYQSTGSGSTFSIGQNTNSDPTAPLTVGYVAMWIGGQALMSDATIDILLDAMWAGPSGGINIDGFLRLTQPVLPVVPDAGFAVWGTLLQMHNEAYEIRSEQLDCGPSSVGCNAYTDIKLQELSGDTMVRLKGSHDELIFVSDRISISGPDPSMGSCGTSPTVTGSDSAGRITMGSGTATTCVMTFSSTMTSTPACVITSQSRGDVYLSALSATGFTISNVAGANMASQIVNYHCFKL